jgi:hypothetical protein
MKKLIIGLDLGNTIFDNTREKISFFKGTSHVLCIDALDVLNQFVLKGHELVVVSKIDLGSEARVTFSLVHMGLMPQLIDPNKVRFCYRREDKGAILREFGAHVIIDDRIEVLNVAHASGVAHKILFTGVRDDRNEVESTPVSFGGLQIVKSWKEVQQVINEIPPVS